jgi:hypothetical protein
MVQEMKRILDKAKDGKISFNKLMNTPIMKTLTDVYQGADNVWKIYTDTAYQGALRTAFGNPDDIIKMAKGSKKEVLETPAKETTVEKGAKKSKKVSSTADDEDLPF